MKRPFDHLTDSVGVRTIRFGLACDCVEIKIRPSAYVGRASRVFIARIIPGGLGATADCPWTVAWAFVKPTIRQALKAANLTRCQLAEIDAIVGRP